MAAVTEYVLADYPTASLYVNDFNVARHPLLRAGGLPTGRGVRHRPVLTCGLRIEDLMDLSTVLRPRLGDLLQPWSACGGRSWNAVRRGRPNPARRRLAGGVYLSVPAPGLMSHFARSIRENPWCGGPSFGARPMLEPVAPRSDLLGVDRRAGTARSPCPAIAGAVAVALRPRPCAGRDAGTGRAIRVRDRSRSGGVLLVTAGHPRPTASRGEFMTAPDERLR